MGRVLAHIGGGVARVSALHQRRALSRSEAKGREGGRERKKAGESEQQQQQQQQQRQQAEAAVTQSLPSPDLTEKTISSFASTARFPFASSREARIIAVSSPSATSAEKQKITKRLD